jgi:hypothetical protein
MCARTRYVAKAAGMMELRLWCEPEGAAGARELLPGCPYTLHVTPGESSAADSYVSEWTVETKRHAEKGAENGASSTKPIKGGGVAEASRRTNAPMQQALGGDEHRAASPQQQHASTHVVAGDVLVVRACAVDQFANPTTLADDALSACVCLPDGREHTLPITPQAKSGRSGLYDVRCETTLAGEHAVHMRMKIGRADEWTAIKGSPARCVVLPAPPTPSTSKLLEPAAADCLVAHLDQPARVVLATFDKCACACSARTHMRALYDLPCM